MYKSEIVKIDPKDLLKSLRKPIIEGKFLDGHEINSLTKNLVREAVATFLIYAVQNDAYQNNKNYEFSICQKPENGDHDGYLLFEDHENQEFYIFEIEEVVVTDKNKDSFEINKAIQNAIKNKHNKPMLYMIN